MEEKNIIYTQSDVLFTIAGASVLTTFLYIVMGL